MLVDLFHFLSCFSCSPYFSFFLSFSLWFLHPPCLTFRYMYEKSFEEHQWGFRADVRIWEGPYGGAAIGLGLLGSASARLISGRPCHHYRTVTRPHKSVMQ